MISDAPTQMQHVTGLHQALSLPASAKEAACKEKPSASCHTGVWADARPARAYIKVAVNL